MDDASDRRQIRKAEREAKARAERSSATLAWIMSTAQGREWFHDLLEKCHIGTTPFARDPYLTAYLCGEQNIGIQLWSAVQQSCPDLYIQMMGESHERSILDDNRHGRDQPGRSGDDPRAWVQSEFEPGSDGLVQDGNGEDVRGYENK